MCSGNPSPWLSGTSRPPMWPSTPLPPSSPLSGFHSQGERFMKVLLASLALLVAVSAAQASSGPELHVSRAPSPEESWTFDPQPASYSELPTADAWRDPIERRAGRDDRWEGGRWDDSRIWGQFGDDDHRHGDFGFDGWHDHDHGWHDHDHDQISAAPESATWMLLACGVGMLGLLQLRQTRQR